MTTRRSQTTLENSPSPSTPEGPGLPVQAKLAAAWTSFMFLYVYVDILVLFWKPGVIEGVLAGTVWGFAIGQTPATIALTLMAIPIFMVVLSMTLPSRANRITNLVVASVQIPYAAFNAVGESWTYFYGLDRTRGADPGLHPALGLDLAPAHRVLRDTGRTSDAGSTCSPVTMPQPMIGLPARAGTEVLPTCSMADTPWKRAPDRPAGSLRSTTSPLVRRRTSERRSEWRGGRRAGTHRRRSVRGHPRQTLAGH
jgi:hypothetical protein